MYSSIRASRSLFYLATKKIGKNNPMAEQIKADNEARQEWNRAVDALKTKIKSFKLPEKKIPEFDFEGYNKMVMLLEKYQKVTDEKQRENPQEKESVLSKPVLFF